jgi:hypothetical protein
LVVAQSRVFPQLVEELRRRARSVGRTAKVTQNGKVGFREEIRWQFRRPSPVHEQRRDQPVLKKVFHQSVCAAVSSYQTAGAGTKRRLESNIQILPAQPQEIVEHQLRETGQQNAEQQVDENESNDHIKRNVVHDPGPPGQSILL